MERSMGKLGALIIAICAISLIGAGDVLAAKKKRGKSSYKTAAVSNGATLTGTLILKSKPKAPKEFNMAKFPQAEFCAQAPSSKDGKRFAKVVNTGKGKSLQDAVVVIEGIKQGKAFALKETHIDMKFCDFLVAGGPSTMTGVVSRSADFTVTNHDEAPNEKGEVVGVLHNPHGFGMQPKKSPNTTFNKGMPTKGETLSFKRDMKKLRRAPVMLLKCDQHEYMQAWFKVVDNPYYAVVAPDGSFSIDQIPAGKYNVTAWHPVLGVKTQEVTLSASGKQSITFEF
jgi:hypothetical protein